MSLFARAWSETAPVASVYERAVLTFMAHKTTTKDGTGSFPSVPNLADYCLCSDRQVQRAIGAMLERGLISEGDQALAAYLPRDRRPVVYDLMIPYGWYSDQQRQEVDEERARQGRPPMTPQERPDIAPAPPKKKRADAGRPKPRATE